MSPSERLVLDSPLGVVSATQVRPQKTTMMIVTELTMLAHMCIFMVSSNSFQDFVYVCMSLRSGREAVM